MFQAAGRRDEPYDIVYRSTDEMIHQLSIFLYRGRYHLIICLVFFSTFFILIIYD
jgi:hypothetical protein